MPAASISTAAVGREGAAGVARPIADRPAARYFPGIDGLRAVAVLSVLIFHLGERFLPGGYAGVDIFFVISGFVVTGSVAHLKADRLLGFQGYFYARRIVRIMPALLCCLLATALARTLFIPAAWLSSFINQVGEAAFFGLSNIVLALNTDDYFSPKAAFNPFVHTWSLGVEEQFYLVFPFLIYFFHAGRGEADRRNKAAIVIGLLSIASFAACGVLLRYRWEYAFYLLPARFWELGCGVVLFLTLDRWKRALDALPPAATALAFLASFALLILSLEMPASDRFPFPLGLLPVAGSAGLIALLVARPQAMLARPFAGRLPVFVGKISYSLYLWHLPVFVLFRWTIGLAGPWKAAAAVALAFALAILSYILVEKPTRGSRWPRTAGPVRVIAAGLVAVCAVAVVAGAVLKLRPVLSLSVTADADTWFPEGTGTLHPSAKGCALDEAHIVVEGIQTTVWTSSHCRTPPDGRRLYVAGNSHAAAYARLLRQLAADTGNEVRLYSRAVCPIIPLDKPVAAHAQNCRQFHATIFAEATRDLKRGDILFLPGLRIPKYADQQGAAAATEVPSADPAAQRKLRSEAVAEAVALLAPLTARGVHVVLEAPTPVFKSPLFRCSDWFNARNEACSGGFEIPRQELESRRRPIVQSMELLTARVDGVSVWDPFPILCGDAVCNARRDNKPLFFDGDHLSGFGDDFLYPDFAAYIAALSREAMR